MKPWHEQDAFWEGAREVLFPARRLEAAAEEVAGFLELTELPESSAVLDLCCGVGRHALLLADRGFRVTGVDRTRAYLEEARARAAERALEIEFLEEDMRSFRRTHAFEGAICFYTSLGFFEPAEDQRVLEHVFASLKPGGVFVVETRGREDIQADFQERDWHEEGDRIILEEREPSKDWKLLKVRWIVVQGGDRRELMFSLHLYSSLEWKQAMRRAGFREIEVHGGLNGHPYDDEATRLVIKGVKPR